MGVMGVMGVMKGSIQDLGSRIQDPGSGILK